MKSVMPMLAVRWLPIIGALFFGYAGSFASVSAQEGVRLSALPSANITRGMKPLPLSRGFNAANARASVVAPRQRAVRRAITVRRLAAPAPILAALKPPLRGSLEEALILMRRQASEGIEPWLAAMPRGMRGNFEAVFGSNEEALRRNLWERFISGAIPIPGRSDTRTAVGYLYNPVIDGLLVVNFGRLSGPWGATSITALAAERVRGDVPSDMPKWYNSQSLALADVMAVEASRARDGFAQATSIDADDAPKLQARTLALMEELDAVAKKPTLRAKFTRSVAALGGADQSHLRDLIGEPALAEQIRNMPRELRMSMVAQGALSTSNGAILLLSSKANPAIIYLIGTEESQKTGRLTPVPVGAAMMRGVQ